MYQQEVSMNEIYLSEYSPAQDAAHIATLKEAVSHNRTALLSGTQPGYVPIGYSLTHEGAAVLLSEFRNELEGRYGRA